MRQAERDRIRIPNELTEKITMLRRTADAVENHIKCVQGTSTIGLGRHFITGQSSPLGMTSAC